MNIENDPSVVVASTICVSEGLRPYRYVVRHLPGEVQPWVCHRENFVFEGETARHESFYWGHYFDSQEEALEDFQERKRESR